MIEVPSQMDIERIVLKEMIAHDDSIRAIRAIPLSLRDDFTFKPTNPLFLTNPLVPHFWMVRIYLNLNLVMFVMILKV